MLLSPGGGCRADGKQFTVQPLELGQQVSLQLLQGGYYRPTTFTPVVIKMYVPGKNQECVQEISSCLGFAGHLLSFIHFHSPRLGGPGI